MFNISPSYLPTLVEGLGIGCKNGDYPCPQLPEEDWAQRGKRGSGSFAKGGGAKTIQGHAAGLGGWSSSYFFTTRSTTFKWGTNNLKFV